MCNIKILKIDILKLQVALSSLFCKILNLVMKFLKNVFSYVMFIQQTILFVILLTPMVYKFLQNKKEQNQSKTK